MLRDFRPSLGAVFLAALLAASAGCANGGGGTPADSGTRDTGSVDTGVHHDDAGDAGAIGVDAFVLDVGPVDSGPPPIGDDRTAHALVSGGHVATSSRYRLVNSVHAGAASAPPSSSRYVLRENVIGRIGEPSP